MKGPHFHHLGCPGNKSFTIWDQYWGPRFLGTPTLRAHGMDCTVDDRIMDESPWLPSTVFKATRLGGQLNSKERCVAQI